MGKTSEHVKPFYIIFISQMILQNTTTLPKRCRMLLLNSCRGWANTTNRWFQLKTLRRTQNQTQNILEMFGHLAGVINRWSDCNEGYSPIFLLRGRFNTNGTQWIVNGNWATSCHESMVLFILRKLILQMHMRSHPVGARCLTFVWTLRLLPYFMCANSEGAGETAHHAVSLESSLVAYVISTIPSRAASVCEMSNCSSSKYLPSLTPSRLVNCFSPSKLIITRVRVRQRFMYLIKCCWINLLIRRHIGSALFA